MSSLDCLIQEFCPNGVEMKTLGEIGTITRGNGLSKSDFAESGFPCIHYGQIYTHYGAFATTTKSFVSPDLAAQLKVVSNGDVIIAVTSENLEDVCKCVSWLGGDDIVTGGHTAILKHNQDPKYIAYYLQTEEFFKQKRKLAHGTKVIEVTPSRLSDVQIPLPPLPIQRKIVEILDNFTELTAELTARKKQYEYYRNALLTFGDEVPVMALGEVAQMLRGEYVTKKNTVRGDIPVILGGQEPAYYCDKSNHEGEAIVISRSGAYAGFVSFWNQPIFVTDGFILETNERMTMRYLFYCLKNKQELLHGQKRGGGVPHVRGTEIMNMLLPVPSLEEQTRIVAILDKFDALTTDITGGLPAEIEARHKQYEYYRDKLLTFKEMA